MRRLALWALLTVGVVGSPRVLEGTAFLTPLVYAGVLAAAVVGLAVLQGQAGIVSLGQGGFVAIGAYTVGTLTADHGVSPIAALITAAFTATLAAAATVPVLRIGGLALSLVTFALGVITTQLIIVFDGFTGGQRGLSGIPLLGIGNWQARTPSDLLVVTWLIVLGLALLAVNIKRSPYGAALRAQRADVDASSALGIDVQRIRSAAWLFAGACAGISGGLLAFQARFLSPDLFALSISIALLAAVIIGGLDSVFGPLVAIALLRIMPEVTDLGGTAGPIFWSGAMLLIVPAIAPGGLAQGARWIGRRARGLVAPRTLAEES